MGEREKNFFLIQVTNLKQKSFPIPISPNSPFLLSYTNTLKFPIMQVESEKESLEKLLENFFLELTACNTELSLQNIRVKYLSKKGKLPLFLDLIKSLQPSERAAFGAAVNSVKQQIESKIKERKIELEDKKVEQQLKEQKIDISLPGKRYLSGRLHPLTQVLNEIIEIFVGLGFEIVEGPELETDWYNFEALNIHKDHPARDSQDSFYIDETHLLRTQTSPVQIRLMEERKQPPIKIIAPGRTFRRDAVDASHSPVFHQIEGLMVDKGITFANLKAVLETFVHRMFGENVKLRLRPDYFPFVEPGAEVAISCIMCSGKGCSVCQRTGWLEILGAGMVHPNVFRNVNFDPSIYTGFAFGMGLERITMLKYSIDDIRLFYENDKRFLMQF